MAWWQKLRKERAEPVAESSPRAPAPSPNYDLLRSGGLVRTDMHCTNCSKVFVAALDFSLDGAHIVECPFCRHEHCRQIHAGIVTEDRWDGRAQRINVSSRRVWKSENQPIVTSTASAFIRDRWLNFGEGSDEK